MKKYFPYILAIALIAALVSVGYFVLHPKQTPPAPEAQPQEQPQQSGEEISTEPKPETLGPNYFSIDTIKVDDKIGEMTVVSIKPFTTEYGLKELSYDNIKIIFRGSAFVSGKYIYHSEEEPFLAGELCFTVSDENFLKNIPRLLDENAKEINFCFSNQESAKHLLDTNGGDATILISEYVINRYPSEVIDTAELIKVINKIPK